MIGITGHSTGASTRMLAIVAMYALAACGGPGADPAPPEPAPSPAPVVRVISGDAEFRLGERLLVPARITAGKPFTATLVSHGSSSCPPPELEARVRGNVAELRYRRDGPRYEVCTEDYTPHPRDVTIRFDRPGTAFIRIPTAREIFERRVTVHR